MKVVIIGVAVLFSHCSGFVLDEITMDEATFAAVSTCDKRADRAGNAVVSDHVRDYMRKNHIKLMINSDDGVQITKSLPNQRIETGHSCTKTAEARGITVNAKMTNSKALDSSYNNFDDINSLFDGDIPHKVTVKADVRVKFGTRLWFGKCNTVVRKTCRVTGSSTGFNYLSVNLLASDYSTITHPNGTSFLYLDLDVDFQGTSKPETYTSFKTNSDCSMLGGLVTMNGLVQKYAGQYVNEVNDAINNIRGPALIRRLEDLLQAKFGETVQVPVRILNTTTGGRKKRAVQNRCQRMKCPSGFSKMGNTKKCQKFFRGSKPNCAQYGNGASLYERKFGSRTYYWCHINMIPQ